MNFVGKKIQVDRYPEKEACRDKLKKAVKSGKIQRPTICTDCNETKPLFAHHEDYSKPLDVIWLCRPCHRKRHGGQH